MAIPEPIPKRSDVQKGLRTVYLNRVAHMGMMLDKMQRNQAAAERLQKFAASNDVNDLNAPAEEQDMGVQIGNEIHYHQYMGNGEAVEQEEPATIPISGTAEPATPPLWGAGQKQLNWWQKGLIGAGALGVGLGAGAVAKEYYYGTPKPPAYVDTDSDTVVETDFPDSVTE